MARHEPEINSLTVACVVAETEEVLDNVHVDRILMRCCSRISAVLRVWLGAEKRWIMGVMGAFPTTTSAYCKKKRKKKWQNFFCTLQIRRRRGRCMLCDRLVRPEMMWHRATPEASPEQQSPDLQRLNNTKSDLIARKYRWEQSGHQIRFASQIYQVWTRDLKNLLKSLWYKPFTVR